MKKSVKLSEKIEALQAELRKARATEKREATASAEHTLLRAVHTSGLLSWVAGGVLTCQALEAEFRALAERASVASAAATEPVKDASTGAVERNGETAERKGFRSRP